MEAYTQIQYDIMRNITRGRTNFKKSPKERITVSYLESRLENLESDWSSFVKKHKEIFSKIDSKVIFESGYDKEEIYEKTEELFIDYKSELKEMLSKIKSKSVSSNDHKSSSEKSVLCKLPKISIPTFSGKYDEWTTFRDLFTSLIHKNDSLDSVQKLHYLKSHLSGEAEKLLRHVPITEDNYSVCWSQLESRFNNKRYLSNCILQRFFNQKILNNESASGVRELLDTTNECLHALENIGVDIKSWDIILIYILSLKLDSESRKLWEAKICDFSSELPKLSQFKEFLEQRFRALEFLDSNKIKSTRNINNVKVLHVQSTSSNSCLYCSDDHKLFNCKKFSKLEIDSRRDFVRTNKLCYNCMGSNHSIFSCRQSSRCRICKKKHHSLLHKSNDAQSESASDSHNAVAVNAATTSTETDESTNIVTCFSNTNSQVLLATALVNVVQSRNGETTLRSLLDQGSQASFITESAVQLLGLSKVPNRSFIQGLGSDQSSALLSSHFVMVNLQSLHEPSFIVSVKAHVLSKLTSLLPDKEVKIQMWSGLSNVKLADPTFATPNKIDLLLGAEVYGQIIVDGVIKGPSGAPLAQKTKFGWILSGQITNECSDIKSCHTNRIISLNVRLNDSELLRKFWELESEHSQQHSHVLTQEEQKCEKFYAETTQRDSSGRYIVRLPFRDGKPKVFDGDSVQIAYKKFHSLEKRLARNMTLKVEYSKVIQEYLDPGHMELIPTDEINNNEKAYLPHHAVVREDKTTSKVRVVFDASSQASNGASLNEDLMVGPTIQSELRHIIMRWRKHPVCLVSDIIKMYRQVIVSPKDYNCQRIVWRSNPNESIEHFRLGRVTFGTSCAPYLAVRTLHQVAIDEGRNFPLAAPIVIRDFYIDDLMTGCQTVSEGLQIYSEVKGLLKKGGFELQKWSSNNEELLREIDSGESISDNHELEFDKMTKVLGLFWNRKRDVFEYCVKVPIMESPFTKRKVISDISKLYDPLGWIAPVTITAKIFIQRIWMTGIQWDESLPSQLADSYLKFRQGLSLLTGFNVPRWLQSSNTDFVMELHGFSDASNEAFAAVVYLRTIDALGQVHVRLVTARTKVAPIKQVSIPRLELCGAVLLTKLLVEVSEVLEVPKEHIHAWTDSSVVLSWLSGHPSKWQTFVGNRVSEILCVLEADQWAHVRSKENPADCASRGLEPSEFNSFSLWTDGPHWLHNEPIVYSRPHTIETDLERKTKTVCHVINQNDEDEIFVRFSSLRRLIRVLAWCKRFSNVSLGKDKTYPKWLSCDELKGMLVHCIKQCQSIHFVEELTILSKKGSVPRRSKLASLNPFLDDQGILRVGGRLDNSLASNDVKHPIIMPRKSHFVDLLISDAHEKTLHGGPQLMVQYLRSKYWVIDAKNLSKLHVRKCVVCFRFAAKSVNPLMGQLPAARVTPSRPFLQSGVDYAGPINVKSSKGRGHHSTKGYICLFVCMATKAVHLEVASDLTAQGFLSAFKRFVARRGHCANLWSDNGTNFVGAAKELKYLFSKEKSGIVGELAENLANNGTTWHFIPPRSPNFGGLWEAGVKSTKHHLKRIIGTSTLSFEELSTVLAQIEACLNSRPISQTVDRDVLTPGHFLVGEPLVLVPDLNYEASNINSLKRWQMTQRMTQHFWRRWSKEYFNQYYQRFKWTLQTPEPQIGNVVLVQEDDLPPAKWLYGVIVQKHPGSDGITRVVSLRYKNCVIKRPVSKLCVLPISS